MPGLEIISIILALVVQTSGAVWWASRVSTKLEYLTDIVKSEKESSGELESRLRVLELKIAACSCCAGKAHKGT